MAANTMSLDDFIGTLPRGELWVFGYGSLMWSPGFSYRQKAVARVHGLHRALCILSTRYRGTEARPGLVMGLCRGGSCWGIAYRVAPTRVRHVLSRLWNREMPRRVYSPRLVNVQLASGRSVRALAFLADPAHAAYARELDLHGRARLVAQGIGVRGPCIEYIRNTLAHMHEIGVRDPHLERVLHAALALRDNGADAGTASLACKTAPPAPRQPATRAAGAVLRRAAGRPGRTTGR